jgi:hypothetical protein
MTANGIEAVSAIAVIGATLVAPHAAARAFRCIERRLACIGRHRGLASIAVGLVGTLGSAAVGLVVQMPQPRTGDEFSYLLAADTFAHGRVTNPPHPLWVHFETFHVIQQPTYASKYPPAQGLILAVGQVLTGHPIAGVWLSVGLMCSAICWMLQGFVPASWALLGAGLAAVQFGTVGYWAQSYYGGAVGATGGALLFGSLVRVMRRPCAWQALLMGVGLAVLANSRPFEGLVASAAAAVVLLSWMAGSKRPPLGAMLRQLILPVAAVVAVTLGWMTYYNFRVTGNPFEMPYMLYDKTYNTYDEVFLFPSSRPLPEYRNKAMRDVYTQTQMVHYQWRASIRGQVNRVAMTLKRLGYLYFMFPLQVVLVALPWAMRDRWVRFALLGCGVVALAVVLSFAGYQHYAAPATSLAVFLVVQGLRHFRLWRWGRRPLGRAIVWLCILLFVVQLVPRMRKGHGIRGRELVAFGAHRAELLAQFERDGGRHLVIVRYGPRHNPLYEWVYNGADIDGGAVVWARAMDTAEDGELVKYFKGRQMWLLTVDDDWSAPTLAPYGRNAQ